jgi:DNA-binding LytR/AlgR family response regulator
MSGTSSMRDQAVANPVRTMLIWLLEGDRLALRRGAHTTIVDRGDIISAHSRRNTTRIVTRLGEFILRAPLHAVLECLTPIGVLRIHRYTAVDATKVRQLVGRGGHGLVVVLDDGRRLAVGRAFQRAVRAHFGAIAE